MNKHFSQTRIDAKMCDTLILYIADISFHKDDLIIELVHATNGPLMETWFAVLLDHFHERCGKGRGKTFLW